MTQRVFINRRKGSERRSESEKRKNPRLDLSHRRRRTRLERRSTERTLTEDFMAFQEPGQDYRRH
jgi:hypothetical protein